MSIDTKIDFKISEVARLKAKYGKMGSGRYGVAELEEMVAYLAAKVEAFEGGLTKEEAIKLRRQLGAANARVARATGKGGEEDAS